jgi:hypothetical protein
VHAQSEVQVKGTVTDDKGVLLQGVSFTPNKNEYFPIPQKELGLNHNLKQKP